MLAFDLRPFPVRHFDRCVAWTQDWCHCSGKERLHSGGVFLKWWELRPPKQLIFLFIKLRRVNVTLMMTAVQCSFKQAFFKGCLCKRLQLAALFWPSEMAGNSELNQALAHVSMFQSTSRCNTHIAKLRLDAANINSTTYVHPILDFQRLVIQGYRGIDGDIGDSLSGSHLDAIVPIWAKCCKTSLNSAGDKSGRNNPPVTLKLLDLLSQLKARPGVRKPLSMLMTCNISSKSATLETCRWRDLLSLLRSPEMQCSCCVRPPAHERLLISYFGLL